MDDRIGRRDLLAVAAAAATLLLAIALDLNIWLAVTLPVFAYAGTILVRSQPATGEFIDNSQEHSAYQAAIANLQGLRKLQARIEKPGVREQVGHILDRVADVLTVMHEDDNLEAAPLFNDRLVMPVRALLTEYARLSNRGVSSAGDLLDRIETHDLPRIERTIDTFYERLHRSHVVDLATLTEVLELDLDSIASTPHRRVES